MLSRENIETLLKIDTENKTDNRCLRILSCHTPVKDFYVFRLKEVMQGLDFYPKQLEEQIALCIQKYNKDMHDYLNGDDSKLLTMSHTTKLNKDIITQAIVELKDFYSLLTLVIIEECESRDAIIEELYSYKMPNYIAILQHCGLVDVNEDVYRSKILDRFHNIKAQAINYRNERMDKKVLLKEIKSHVEFFSKQLDLIEKYNMYDEDFLIFTIMFDIRHFKHNRNNNKSLRKCEKDR